MEIKFSTNKKSQQYIFFLYQHFCFLFSLFIKNENKKQIRNKELFLLGRDFKFSFSSFKNKKRITYSGSPHAQTKKGRDLLYFQTKKMFSLIIHNKYLQNKIYIFLKSILLKYKFFSSNVIIEIKK